MSMTWLRRSATALVGALALAVVAVTGPSAPEASAASAASYKSKLCWTVMEDGRLKVYCVDIQVQWPWDKIFECWMCGVGLDWTHDPVLPESVEGLVGQHVVNGLATLGDARYAPDPATRDRLRAAAMEQFSVATRYAGGTGMRFLAAGEANPEKNTFVRMSLPWMQAAGVDAADGITLLQRAAATADPREAARLRALATAEFDEAYAELSEQRVIG
ncbi:MAG TPA: hypothetical protein VGD67_11225 [Pseudonocardiaceae bacterium]